MHTDHQEIFDLQEELSYYCQQDGKIWREACRSYREKIMVMACHTVDEKESDEKVKLYFCVDPFLCNVVTSTPMSRYWFIAFIGGKRYLTNDIHTWPKRRIFKPVMHYTAVGYQARNCFWGGKVISNGRTTTFKYNGCFFHGFIECHHENDWNHPVGTTFGCSRYTMKWKMDGLTKAGFTIRSRWEYK